MKNNKTPSIRFKGFTDPWEQRKLGDVIDFLDTLRKPLKETDREPGPYPYYGASGIVDHVADYIFDEELILLSEDGANITDRNYPVCFLATGKYWVNNHAHVLKARNKMDNNFICMSMERKDYSNYNTGMAMPKLNKDTCCQIPVDCPTFEEQKKIGDYFRNLDNLITLHQRKYDKLQNIKKSMLEKMFPKNGSNVPEIRFSGFTDPWEQRKFSEIASRESTTQESSRDFPSVEYEDVITEAGRLNKDVYQKEAVKKGIVFDGSQVLYGKLRPYLHNWLNPEFSGVAVGDWWVLKPIETDKSFLYRLIQTQQFDDVANQSTGSKMPRADWNLVSDSEFAVPISQNEQAKIGEYFENLDNLITLHQRELEKLQNIKKSMLEKMFV